MNKQNRHPSRLTVGRTTLRALLATDLAQVAGALTKSPIQCPPSCDDQDACITNRPPGGGVCPG
jgi:hypothetical protein